MTLEGEYQPSPEKWVRDQVETYPYRPTRVADSIADLVPLVTERLRRSDQHERLRRED